MSDRTEEQAQRSAANEGIPTSTAEAESDAGSPTVRIVRKGGTFESFRHRGYLLFWSGALVSNVGSWMQTAVISLIAYSFRRSELDLGLVTFATQIPNLVLTLPGGVIADRVDKRKLIIWAQVLLMLQAVAFGVLYVTGNLGSGTPVRSLVIVGGLGLFAGVLTAMSFPAWQAIIPDLVPRENLLNAIALNSAQFQSGRMLGGAAALGVIAVVGQAAGIADVFWINAVSFLFVIAALIAVKTSPHAGPKPANRPAEGMWTSLKEGVRYSVSHRLIGIVILSTAILTFVGMPYVVLLPSVADKVLGYHAYTNAYTILFTVNGLGALAGALIVASLPHTIRRERLMRWTILATAIILVAFAFTPWLWLSAVLSTLAGALILTTNSLANTSVQDNVPHHLRGRVMGVYITCFLGVMPLSAAAFGPLAQAIGPSWAITVGAVVLMAWALVLIARPSLLTAAPAETE
jgi:MFS family permease